MRISQARDAARQWVIDEASGVSGFCGAYTAGSTNWLSDDAELTKASDLDISPAHVDGFKQNSNESAKWASEL
jgi:hypothetical protein